ncbi:MAG: hypothetical protein IBX71_05915 [Candidatus Desulforudis sp.]|nr:hypothetical protein [Desulforudis sp.]
MKVSVPREVLKHLADQLSLIEQDLKAVKVQLRNLYAAEGGKEIPVHTIRALAPLAEVVRAGGNVSPLELSWFCRKYGKHPKGAAGYFTGTSPSMKSGEGDRRMITDQGLARVRQAEMEYGKDWLDRVPLDIVANPEVDADTLIYL